MFTRKHGSNKYLKRIKVASKTLSTIYDDMDYLIEYESAKFRKKRSNFSQFLQNRIDYFEEIAGEKKVQIISNIEEDITIFFSKTKLQRLIDNTLSNAIKYSYDDKDIIITLFQKDKKIYFSIEDFGVGIGDVDKIFQRYYREDFSKGGFGIGLDIVKKIVDNEGILMDIKSQIKEGTTFTYIFDN
jgi:signal transduction histidine kinase